MWRSVLFVWAAAHYLCILRLGQKDGKPRAAARTSAAYFCFRYSTSISCICGFCALVAAVPRAQSIGRKVWKIYAARYMFRTNMIQWRDASTKERLRGGVDGFLY